MRRTEIMDRIALHLGQFAVEPISIDPLMDLNDVQVGIDQDAPNVNDLDIVRLLLCFRPGSHLLLQLLIHAHATQIIIRTDSIELLEHVDDMIDSSLESGQQL